MKLRRELKAESRDILARNIFSKQWLHMVLVTLVFALVACACCIIPIADIFLAIFIIFPLSYGWIDILLLQVRRKENFASVKELFDGFTEKYKDKVVLELLKFIFVFLWSLLLIIPGIIKFYSYRQASFLLADHPDWTWKQALNKSKEVMEGRKWKLFVLDLSFLGWFVLGMITFGIGMLWVTPYYELTCAGFYEEVKDL